MYARTPAQIFLVSFPRTSGPLVSVTETRRPWQPRHSQACLPLLSVPKHKWVAHMHVAMNGKGEERGVPKGLMPVMAMLRV